MPLARGYSPETFEKNISTLTRENRRRKRKLSRAQILAIAYAKAREAASRAGLSPEWLRGRKRRSKHRRSR